MTRYFSGKFERSKWLDLAKPHNYEWAPDEIDTELWYDIIDAFGMPEWIRGHRTRASQPWISVQEQEESIYVKPYGTITTDDMRDVTNINWIPIARMYDGSESAAPRDIFLGYFADDFDMLEAGTTTVNLHSPEMFETLESMGVNRTLMLHLPTSLYL